jgi:hypothetical protein
VQKKDKGKVEVQWLEDHRRKPYPEGIIMVDWLPVTQINGSIPRAVQARVKQGDLFPL